VNRPSRGNQLRVGDNLQLLRDRSIFPDESIDLIYLDPPLQPHRGSHQVANEVPGVPYDPIIPAKKNIWRWDNDAAERYNEVIQTGNPRLRAVIAALQTMLGHSAMFAYLVHMTPRLQESHRIVKRTGSVFLHCDTVASHYMKILMDALFGQRGLVNEIVWKRITSHGDIVQPGNHMGRIHDIILFYRKSERGTFHVPMVMGSDQYVDHFFPHTDFNTGRRYRLGDVTTPKKPPHPQYEWRIKRHGETGKWVGDIDGEFRQPAGGWEYRLVEPFKGRFWALPHEIMLQAEREGMLVYSRVGYPHVKRFMPAAGVPVQDIWTDVAPVVGSDRLYASQKPRALLERIISMASNAGDVVLDPFCGSGPALEAVEMLNRQSPDEAPRTWIGIDASSLAINLVRNRLGRFTNPPARYKVIGGISDLRSAELFAARHPTEFQYWAFSLMGARPMGGERARSGGDRPVDGVRHFKEKASNKPSSILVQAKIGNAKLEDVRALRTACAKLRCAMGVLISLQEPTSEARMEAEGSGEYYSATWDRYYPVLQIATVDDLLLDLRRHEPACLDLPPRYVGEAFK
jgi:hypothetical protein